MTKKYYSAVRTADGRLIDGHMADVAANSPDPSLTDAQRVANRLRQLADQLEVIAADVEAGRIRESPFCSLGLAHSPADGLDRARKMAVCLLGKRVSGGDDEWPSA